jgi:hypothetical protein
MIFAVLAVGAQIARTPRCAQTRQTVPCAAQAASLPLPPAMLDDAANALTQMFSPPLRAVLWKSIGLALALIIAIGIALERLIVWLVGSGSASVETTLGPHAHLPASILAWLLSIAASLGIIVGSVMLMPAVTAFVASFFADEIAAEVERTRYPADPPGVALPLWLAMREGGKTALLAIAVYLCHGADGAPAQAARRTEAGRAQIAPDFSATPRPLARRSS